MSTSEDGRRAIARRNASAILDAALEVLREDPAAGLGDVAAAAGVGRATLYRHYPSREALLDALRADVQEHIQGLLAQARLEEGDPLGALERFVAALWEVRDRYGLLGQQRSADDEERVERIWLRLHDVVVRAQQAGQLDAALPATLLIHGLRGALRGAIRAVDAGELARADGPSTAMRAFLRGAAGARG